MAQVLAPIVQSTGSITMLHSSPDAFQNQPAQPHHQQPRSTQMPRNQIYNSQSGVTGYRGASAPIAPYAFSSTPQLRQEARSSSAPDAHPQQQQGSHPVISTRLGHPTHPSSSSDSTVSTSGSSSRSLASPQFASKEDSTPGPELRRVGIDSSQASAINLSTAVPDLSFSLLDVPAKPSPDRYRRGTRRSDSSYSGTVSPSTPTPTQQSPSISATTAIGTSQLSKAPSLSAVDLETPTRPGHNRSSSVDDMESPRQNSDTAKRYRRRSLNAIDVVSSDTTSTAATIASAPIAAPSKRTNEELRPPSSSSRHASRPTSSQGHQRQGSAGSSSSGVSNRPPSRQESSPLRASATTPSNASIKGAPEVARRMAPSPLSNPISSSDASNLTKEATGSSPAFQQLSALNDTAGGKGVKSRLRRAFSFGSAAELRRASAENNLSAERAKLRKDRYNDEDDAEQAAIVAKQEAAGIGAGIYSGQGGFTSSTDNISISSTASSASIMLRKMGNGMKKGSRSIKGLFRPKSVIGVPAADGPITMPSVGQVSMVTVEAERQKVNVNADPHDQTGGGTGYPKLERNSLDAVRSTADANSSPSPAPKNDSLSRRSIVGGDRERAEVLSSIKKGILKRRLTNSDASSTIRPTDIPHLNETPKSTAPSTPNNELAPQVQVHIHGDDYFGRPARLLSPSTRSLPSTPNGGSRNISFSPRIQCHEAHSASDYDRRGEIATCNRLTPMLAQQIKEELNTFKMEMEVHELSKPHTHFF